MDLNRRFFLRGALSVLAAPAIIKVAGIMPIKAPPLVYYTPYLADVLPLPPIGFRRLTAEQLAEVQTEAERQLLLDEFPVWNLWADVRYRSVRDASDDLQVGQSNVLALGSGRGQNGYTTIRRSA